MTMVHGNGHTTGALTYPQPDTRTALEPRSLDEGFRLAQIAAKSQMFGVRSPEEAFIRIATGVSLGIPAVHALRLIDVVNNKPVLAAKLKVGLCLKSPECERFEMVESTAEKATYVAQRRGREPKPLTYTIEMAKRAGYTSKDNWKQNPEAMLRARCSSALADIVFPDVTLGLPTVEEAHDYDVKPPAEAPAVELVPQPRSKAQELEEQFRTAASPAAWNAACAAVRAAHAARDITDEEVKKLKAVATKYRPAPTPVPAPVVETPHDDDGVVEEGPTEAA